MPLVKNSVVIVSLSLLTACQSSQTNSGLVETITDAEAQLAELIQDKSCDASYQCRVLAYGERACGGPSRFDVYSIKASNQEEVEFLSNEITLFEKSYNKNTRTFSTCEHNISPQTLCLSNTCQVVPPIR